MRNVSPLKPQKLSSAHPSLNSEDQQRLQIWRLSTIATIEQTLLFVARQSATTLIAYHRATDKLHHVFGERQTPIADSDFKDMA